DRGATAPRRSLHRMEARDRRRRPIAGGYREPAFQPGLTIQPFFHLIPRLARVGRRVSLFCFDGFIFSPAVSSRINSGQALALAFCLPIIMPTKFGNASLIASPVGSKRAARCGAA